MARTEKTLKALMTICRLLLALIISLLNVESSSAQQLSVEDRACITAATAKLPQTAALKVERSRVLLQPHTQGRRDPNLYNVKVEIELSVAGQNSTYIFNCIHGGLMTLIQPLACAESNHAA